jgi:hypothetical protein
MKRKLRVLAAILALAATAMIGADSVAGQICMESTDGCGEKRLYPKSANPDGSLNCAPKCDRLGPCC